MVSRTERGLLPAVETLTEFDLGDGARTEVPDIPGISGAGVTGVALGIVTIAYVGVISPRFGNTAIDTKGKVVGIVGMVPILNETLK